MDRIQFQIKITGPRPEEVSASILADIITRIEAAVVAFLKQADLSLSTDSPLLSLVNVAEGSPNDVLTFSSLELALPAVSVISGAIASEEYSALPRDTHLELYKISEKVRRNGWGLEFLPNPSAGIAAAAITPSRGVPPPLEPAIMRGTTTLLAHCLRVGGATSPKVEVRPLQGGKALNLDVTEELAKQLGRRLYSDVFLHGTASWDASSWELIGFKVESVTDFDRISPAETFRELARKSKNAWDGVDAVEFVKSLRGED